MPPKRRAPLPLRCTMPKNRATPPRPRHVVLRPTSATCPAAELWPLDGPYARRAAELVNSNLDADAAQKAGLAEARRDLIVWIQRYGDNIVAEMRAQMADSSPANEGPYATATSPFLYVDYFVHKSDMPRNATPASVATAVLLHLTRRLGGPRVAFEVRQCDPQDTIDFGVGLQVCAIFAD